MRLHRLGPTLAVLLTAQALAATPALAQDPGDVDKDMRESVLAKMRPVALSAGLIIDEAAVEYAVVNGGVSGSVPVHGFWDLKASDFAQPRDVGVVYSSVPLQLADKSTLPAGSYLARVTGAPGTPNATAQLVSEDGKVMAETPLRRECAESAGGSGGAFALASSTPWSGGWGRAESPAPLFGGTAEDGFQHTMTRCYGFVMYCKIVYSGGWYSTNWYWCGVCFGFWW